MTETENKRFACDRCDETQSEKWKLVAHIGRHDSDGKLPNPRKRKMDQIGGKIRGKEARVCDQCQTRKSDLDSLQKHMAKRHHNNRQTAVFACFDCEKSLNSKPALIYHVGICDPTTTQSGHKKRVVKAVRANKGPEEQTVVIPFHKCQQCGAEFYRDESFTQHVRFAHRRGTELLCLLGCPLKFDNFRSYWRHIKFVHVPQMKYPLNQNPHKISLT